MQGRKAIWAAAGGIALALVLSFQPAAARPAGEQSKKKPSLQLRVSPAVGFAHSRFRFIAILEGGDDDYQEYYCPSIEWDWDDDTVSESSPDCEPYEPGRSRISRRYSASHVFQQEGRYEVKFKLKRNDEVLQLAMVTVQVGGG